MKKGAQAFRSIGEVAELIGVAPHVLRYWETQFSQLKPMKRPDGRRYYRPEDLCLAAGLCEVLRDQGLTIRGAKKLLAKDRGETVRQRGSARLAEVAGLELASAPKPPERAEPVLGDLFESLPQPVAEAPAATERDVPGDHPPRARHRRRRHADEASHPARAESWLLRLILVSDGLRRQGKEPRPDGFYAAARQVRDAIAALA